ncbi:LPD38 domain-containing protein [Salmonella enterica]|uniref:LPD38 domain-containing protein n=1 Tax=Salmonella enterica TaxID=28901 RepID=UPI003D2EF8D6
MPLIPDVRPETQKINPNRTDLNIAQPGEQPAFDYDSYLDSLTPETVKDYRTGANLKDYGIAVTSGAANLPEGVGALANFGGQWLKKKAGELSPDHFVAKSALSDIGGFLHKGGQAVQEGVSDWKQDLESGYSEQAKNALEQGATGSIAGLTLNLANVFGDLGSIALTGGLEGLAVKGATSALLKREAVSGLVRKGLSKEAAEKVANDAMEVAARKATAAQAGKTASKYGFIAGGTADAQGNTAASAAQGVLNASPQELASSPTFVNLYQSVQSDPQYAHLSDADKVQVAKEQLASRVGMSVATDPKLLAVNIGSTMMGDKAVADMVLNGVSKSIVGGFTKGALREGALNGLQSGYSQYAQNVARDEDAGIATDHMQGVMHAAGEGTLLGGIIGGGAGLVSGVRGRNSKPDTQRTDAAHEAFNARAERAREMAEDSPYTTPADPVENYRRQFSGLSRDELLEHYANADFAPEGDAEAVYRKHAASGLLRDMDRTRQVKGMIDEMRAKPRSEVLEEYRTLSEKEKRSDAEEIRLDAAREVLKPQPEAGTEDAKPAEAPQEPGISVPTVRFGDDVPHIEITGGAPRPPERIEKVRSDNDYFADARGAKNSDVFRHAEQAGLKPEVVKKGERQYVVEMDNPQVSEDRARETINTLAMGERIPDKPKTPDPMEIPAFMRDPRFRDFTDEPTDVQKRLTRGNAPTAEELVHEQMAKGDAGPTDYELAERPRLPPPGDIHPGQGYPLPGDVRRMPDEPPAGRGGRYTTTGEVRGQSYEKGRQTVAPEGVQRQGETFPGEPSYRELPAPVRQGLPRPEIAEPEKVGQQKPATEKTGEKIDDFGEVIHGAAKHRRAALAEELNTDKTAEDYYTQPLSKLFPEPAYEKMAAEGTDNRTLAMLALLRNMIPAKPRVPHRLNRWAKQVDEVRDTAGQLLDGSLPADKFIDRIRQERGSYYSEMVKTWEMLHRLPPAQMKQAAGYRVKSHAYSMVNGKEYNPPKVVHTLENEKGRSVLNSEDLNDLYKKAKAYFEQQSALPKSADSKTKLDIYQNRRTGEVFIAYGKNKTSLQGGFKTAAEARDYVKNNRAELLEKLNALREQSREEQRNASNRDRTGPDRREGDVTPEKFSDAFGFRGVQFGNYVEGPRRQSDLNRAYDSLMDMADVLKVPAKALSLNGRLGLAFGARGKGGKNTAAAHYEPGQVAINLTKGHGAGSLAHEWFHALDNYFGQYDAAREGEITSGDKFMTSNNKRWPQWNDKEKEYLHPVRQEVYDAFKGVVSAVHKSGMVNRARRLDEVRSKPYWSTDVEMAARAFERYVQDRAKAAGVENDFLVNIRKADDHGSPETYAYPTDAELDGGIRRAFDNLFRTLKTRETDRGVAFYSRRGVKRTPEGNVISETGHSKEAKGSPVPQVKAVARTVMKRIKDIDLDVRVVKTQAEAAELAGESLDGYGKVHAFYRPEAREIVLVADNLPDGRTVREKLRHEIIHHALESVVTPAEYKTIVDNVLKTRASDNAVIRETWRRVDADYGNESPEVQAGEFLAHMAEKHTPGKLSAAWNRVVALVKAMLRRTGLLQPSDLSDAGYIRDTLRTLGQRVREGYVPREGGDVSYSRAGKPDPFRVPEGEGERYRRDLAKMMSSLRSGDLKVDIGRTPPVLRHLGAPDLPVSISRDVVRKAINGVSHDVKMETIEKLPELMHDPLAVYDSATQDNALVLWLDAVDENGDPVLAAVHMNDTKKRIEINRVASVYGTRGRMNKINRMEEQGLALYRSEKLSRDNPQYSGLQLPKEERSYHGLSKNILSPDDIRKGPYYSRSTSDLSPEETLAARFVRRMQDKFQVLKAVQDNIRKSGGKLDDSNNAYLAEELFHGKAENDLNAMKERYVKPLAKLLAEYDIPQSALDDYLYARHAPERNLHIAKINPKMPDGGSGMTNAQAADIMDRVRRSGKQAQYDRLAGIVDDMLARRRELITEAGLEDKGTVDAWQKAYKYYVPLKGQDTDGVVLPRTGKGFVISGRESKQAMGRNSRAQSPSTQAMQDLTASLIRRRKNEVGNAFLKLVQDNPDRDYWQVFTDDKPDTTRRIVEKNDPVTGETIRRVEEMPVPMAMMSDKYFTTRKDGKTYYIKLHDERLMRAMKNMGPETGNVVIQTLARVNRFLSSVNTTFNPEFLVSNFVRDMQTAVMNLKAEQGRDDGKLNGRDIAMKTVRDSGIAMKAVYASLRNKSLSGKGAQWQKTWKEFVEDGAKTGWFRMDDLNGQMKEMDRLVALAKGGWQGQGVQAWHSFFKLVEDGNNAVENALRLSAYKHARDAGLSRAQAASLAKNMTVNFNRRGEQGVLLNSLYMFANASIQGTANMMRSLAHLNGEGPLLQRLRWKNLNMAQKVALAATGAGYLIASLNRVGAGQDDDGVNWYDKVPDYVKEHNLVIMKSLFGGKPGEYWSIPLPYGYNMFFLLGGTAEGVIRGDLKATRAAGNIVGGLLGAFNPLGSEDSKTLTGTLLKNATPTIFRPAMDLAMNENFMGTQIYRENFPGGTPKPESTLGRRSTPEAYKVFADWLNRTGGGSQYRSGAVDINPDIMKYWIDYVSGGMGRFAGKTIDAAAKSYNGTDIPSQQIPFLGKISGQVLPYDDQQKMYDRIDELRQYDAELKTLRGADRTAFLNKYRGQISMNGIIHQTQHQLKNLRKQRDEIYSDPTLSAREQSQRVKAVELRMKAVTDRFNREYREKVGD